MDRKSYSQRQMINKKLFPVCRNSNYLDVVSYIDVNSDLWNGSIVFLNDYIIKYGIPNDLKYYKKCMSTARHDNKCFFHISNFDIIESDKKLIFSSSVKSSRRINSRKERFDYRKKNLPFIRMYNNGDENIPVYCPILKIQIDSINFWGKNINVWQQHHFRVIDNSSVNKNGDDPGRILSTTDFTIPSAKSRYGIEDMSGTIFLSPTAHEMIHKASNNSDITNYSNDQLPWALKNEKNWKKWNYFLESHGYLSLGSYGDWIVKQKND